MSSIELWESAILRASESPSRDVLLLLAQEEVSPSVAQLTQKLGSQLTAPQILETLEWLAKYGLVEYFQHERDNLIQNYYSLTLAGSAFAKQL